jgi:hypothetical protein
MRKQKEIKMKSPLSPNDIDVLLWYYSSQAEHPRCEAPAVQSSIQMFAACGMLIKQGGVIASTDKGKAMVSALCRVPEPKRAWVDGNGNVLDE